MQAPIATITQSPKLFLWKCLNIISFTKIFLLGLLYSITFYSKSATLIEPCLHFEPFCLSYCISMGWSRILVSSVRSLCSRIFITKVQTEAQIYIHIQIHINTQTNVHKYICRGWKQSSYLQSQRLPSHVLEQSGGWGERALWAFLQCQGDTCRVPTQQVHQVLQLPAHLANINSMIRVSTTHRHPYDSDYKHNKLIFQYEHPVRD